MGEERGGGGWDSSPLLTVQDLQLYTLGRNESISGQIKLLTANPLTYTFTE